MKKLLYVHRVSFNNYTCVSRVYLFNQYGERGFQVDARRSGSLAVKWELKVYGREMGGKKKKKFNNKATSAKC